jgi:glycosyltransferase involved in cell wall biosynthesis
VPKNIQKKKLKISVVTVCLNSEKTIDRCLKSLIHQNYPKKNIEHIIIDGGSTDNTLKKITKKNKYIKFIQSKKDKGIYDAMNIGIKKCTGDIIVILNSDDFFFKNAFKIATDYFNKYKIDYLFGSVIKNRIYHNFFPKKIFYSFNFYPSHSISFFIRKEALAKIGKYNIKFRYSADRDLLYKLIKNKKYTGMATKKMEIFGKFSMSGISSRVSFFKKNLEEAKIRLNNNESFFKVLLLLMVYLNYYFFKMIINFLKTINSK